jgi:hypothetical protein
MMSYGRARCARGGHFVACVPFPGDAAALVLPLVGIEIFLVPIGDLYWNA